MKELGQVTELVRGGAGTETRAAGLLSLCPTTPRGRADACAHVHLGVQGQHCSGELGQPHAALHAPCTGLGCGRQFLPHTPPLLLRMLTFWCFVRPRLVEVGRPWEATTEGGAGHPRCWGALSPGGGRGQGVGDQEVTARDRADGAGGPKARCTVNLRPGRLRLGPPHTAPGTSPVAGQCEPRLPVVQKEQEGRAPTQGLAACGLRGHPRRNRREVFSGGRGFGARGRAGEGGGRTRGSLSPRSFNAEGLPRVAGRPASGSGLWGSPPARDLLPTPCPGVRPAFHRVGARGKPTDFAFTYIYLCVPFSQ